MDIRQDDTSLGKDVYRMAIFCGRVLYMTGQTIDLFETRCCSRCTRMHEPWHHNGMTSLSMFCKEGTLQDGMARGKDVDMPAPSPFGSEEYIFHMNQLYYALLMQKKKDSS